MRLSIATTFLLYASVKLAGEKHALFFAFVLGAALFHYSSLAFLVIPIIYFCIKKQRVTPLGCCLLALSAGLVVFFQVWPSLAILYPADEVFDYLPRKLSAYLSYRTKSALNYNKLFLIILCLGLYISSCRERYCFSLRTVCYSAFVVSLFSIVAFHQRDVLADRFSELFIVPLTIFLPTYLTKKSVFLKPALLVTLLVIVAVPVYFYKIRLFCAPC